MSFPWPPLRLLLLAVIVALVALHWLSVLDSILAGVIVLYGLLVVLKA